MPTLSRSPLLPHQIPSSWSLSANDIFRNYEETEDATFVFKVLYPLSGFANKNRESFTTGKVVVMAMDQTGCPFKLTTSTKSQTFVDLYPGRVLAIGEPFDLPVSHLPMISLIDPRTIAICSLLVWHPITTLIQMVTTLLSERMYGLMTSDCEHSLDQITLIEWTCWK